MMFIALCTGGLENECMADLLDVPGITSVEVLDCNGGSNEITICNHTYYQGESGCGKLLVNSELESPPTIPSVLCWLVYIHQHTTASLTDITTCIFPESFWKVAASRISYSSSASFVVRCLRGGSHTYSSIDVSRQLGELILSFEPQWRVDLHKPDVEVIVLILNNLIVIGINVSPDMSFKQSRFPASTSSTPTPLTLRHSTIVSLSRHLNALPGKCILECCFGSSSGDGIFARRYVAGSGEENHCVNWDSYTFPFKTGSIDGVLLQMPLRKGIKIANNKKIRNLEIVLELSRIVAPEGRLVIVMQAGEYFASCLNSPYFDHIVRRGINIGGLVCNIITAMRSSTVWSDPEDTTGVKRKHITES